MFPKCPVERRGFFLKPGTKVTAPGVLFSIGTIPSVNSVGGDESNQWWEWGGATVTTSRWRRGHWGRERSEQFDTTADLHKWIEEHADRDRINYVCCPEGAETAAQVRFWDHIDTGQVKYLEPGRISNLVAQTHKHPTLTVIRRMVYSPRCFVVDYTRRGIRFKWFGGRQFFHQPEPELGTITKEPWAGGIAADTPTATWARSPKERAGLWLHLMQHLADWWRTNAKAPFGLTAAALSLGMLRTHVAPNTLTTHTHRHSLPLERHACFGGMARCWYFGDVIDTHGLSSRPAWAPPPSRYGAIDGPIYLYDTRSMYPHLLRERLFPTAHYRHTISMKAGEVQKYAQDFGVIARVTIETDAAEYPERVGGRIYYRTGRFTTTLCGPELLALREDGKVIHCHEATLYWLGRPFAKAAAALIALREAARLDRQPAWEMVVKAISNGMAGKLAQRRGEWQDRPKVAAEKRYGEWMDVRGKGAVARKYRSIAGIVTEWVPDPLGAGPYTAAFAYLAAYGRVFLRRVRDVCPDRSVLSMDTDGAWVTGDGADSIVRAGFVRGDGSGSLRCSSTAHFARFLGARHYCTDRGWVLSGFTSLPTTWAAGVVADCQRFTSLDNRTGGPPRGTSVRVRASSLKVESHGVRVSKDGWATPTVRPG